MQYFVCTFYSLLFFTGLYAQSKPADSSIAKSGMDAAIVMTAQYGSGNAETTELLRFQNIDYFKVRFAGPAVKGAYLSLVAKEIWDGKLKHVDTIINTRTRQKIGAFSSDTLLLNVYGKPIEGNQLKLDFEFPERMGVVKKYPAIHSDEYSLRAIGSKEKIEKGKYFHAFTYILPYEADGWKMYCAVDDDKDVANWGKKFGLKHYLIFEMMFD